MNPKISVIMAVYNAEKYLRESIESILEQTFQDFEFIIVNDGSTDRSSKIIKSYYDKRIVSTDQLNAGVAKARNQGIQNAKADYIAVQDADDISFKNRLETQYNFVQKNKDHVVVGSNAEKIDKNGNFVCYSNVKTTDREIKNDINKMPFINPSVMFNKSAFVRAGQYPEYMYNIAEDLILFSKMENYGKMANLSECLIKYRIVPDSCCRRSNKKETELNRIISKAIKYNAISKIDVLYLKNRLKNTNSDKILSNYYLYLAKKYLWNNYQPGLARQNLFKSLKINPFFLRAYFHIGFSFLPEKVIANIYNSQQIAQEQE